MRISVIAVVAFGLLAGVARAQPVPDKAAAQAAYSEGQQRYATGDYLPAAVKFEAAYAFDPDPVYLFNVAQAYRLGNACSKAVTYYNRFLEAVPNAPDAKLRPGVHDVEIRAPGKQTQKLQIDVAPTGITTRRISLVPVPRPPKVKADPPKVKADPPKVKADPPKVKVEPPKFDPPKNDDTELLSPGQLTPAPSRR